MFFLPRSLRDAESFQDDEVRPALGLQSEVPITAEHWNQFLARKSTLRARIERQTLWRGESIGVELANLCTTLLDAPPSYQLWAYAVTISQGQLLREQCLLVASLLYDYVRVKLEPLGLQEHFDKVEAEALAGGGGI